jgi:hypothetical protein
MVEDRVTDGKRIAQLLSSELSGRETGPLGSVTVVDADPRAKPNESGTEAYGIAVEGTRVGTVWLYPEYATVRLGAGADTAVGAATDAGIPAQREGYDAVLRVESGVAVKRAVDAVAAAVGRD